MMDMSHYAEKQASDVKKDIFNTKKSKPLMLTHKFTEASKAIHMYVMITQIYVLGHRRDTTAAVSIVPPTGSQSPGL